MYDRFIGHRINATTLPTEDFADLLRENVMPIAPNGCNQVHICDGTTTQANESAIALSLLKFAENHKMKDASNLSVLGFEYGHHGNSFATLSCSDERVNL